MIQPLTDLVLAKRRVDSEVESRAIQVLLQTALFLQDDSLVGKCTAVLATRKPVPVALARAAFWRGRAEPDDLPERLRSEHPASLECKLMAARIEGQLQGKSADAFRAAMQLIDEASSKEDREQVFGTLTELAPRCGEKECAEVERVAHVLLSDNPVMMRLFEAGVQLGRGQTEEAGATLEGLRDESNPIWHLTYGNYLIQKGEGLSALEHLRSANRQLNHPDIFRRIAETAYRYEQTDNAIAALEQLLSIQPHDTYARHNLAALYVDKGDCRSAVRHLDVLRQLEPEEVRHHLHCAACLARSGDVDEAIAIYGQLCAASDPPLQAIIGRAQLMKSAGQVKEAYDSLIPYREGYWDEPAYLYELQDLGFASQNEEVAGEAVLQIQRLQAEGRVAPEALRTMDLEAAVGMFREEKEHQDRIHEQVLLAKVPWPMAELGLRRVPYWGWMVRTQPLPWVGDDPVARSSSAVYSTHGSGIHVITGRTSFEQIPLPERDREVVIDISALITLHQLGLLGKAADYFGRILVPAVYVAQALEDGSKLAFHQMSQKTAIEQIKQAVESDQIRVLDADTESPRQNRPYVNEYSDEGTSAPHAYRLRDLSTPLHGYLDDEQSETFRKIAHAQSGVDAEHPELALGQEIAVDLTTLKTIARDNLLAALLRAFPVHIEPHAHASVLADARAIAAQENVQEWHSDLWRQVRTDPRFVQAAFTMPKELRDDDDRGGAVVGFASCLLAGQVNLPLFADDRVIQAFARSASPHSI